MVAEPFVLFAASYDTLAAAEADYRAVGDLYRESGLIDTYDAAVITRDETRKIRVVDTHEQRTRPGGWHGLAGAGLRPADLKDLGELLDEGHGGLLVVAASDFGDRVEQAIGRANRLTRKQLTSDEAPVARDVEVANPGPVPAAVPDQAPDRDRGHQQAMAEAEFAVAEAEAEAEAAERAAEEYSKLRPARDGGNLVSLDDLTRLRDSGALSAAEFEAAKSKLLGG